MQMKRWQQEKPTVRFVGRTLAAGLTSGNSVVEYNDESKELVNVNEGLVHSYSSKRKIKKLQTKILTHEGAEVMGWIEKIWPVYPLEDLTK